MKLNFYGAASLIIYRKSIQAVHFPASPNGSWGTGVTVTGRRGHINF